LPDLVRASVRYYNTEEEVARFGAAVAALAWRRASGSDCPTASP